jgi:hypothetical protein
LIGDPPSDQEGLSVPNQHASGPAGESARPDTATSRSTDMAAATGVHKAENLRESEPDRLNGLRVAGKEIHKSILWLGGIIVTALVTGVVGHITGGWFNSPSHVVTGQGPTQVRLMQPFSTEGKLLPPYKVSSTARGGSCINSYESSDPDALRCFAGNQVADPCWSYGSQVACLGAPWDAKAFLIINPAIHAEPRASIGPVPWALEIDDPAKPTQTLDCGFAGGTAAEIVAGLRANWDCFRAGEFNSKGFVGYALGTPQATKSRWTVFYAAADKSQAVEAQVVIAWR